MIAAWKKVLFGLSIPWGLAWMIGIQLLLGIFTVYTLAIDLAFSATGTAMYIWILLRLRER